MPQMTAGRAMAVLIVLVLLIAALFFVSYLMTYSQPTRILEHGPVFLAPTL